MIENELAALRRVKAPGNGKAGIVDALIAELAASEGSTRTVTFDKAAARMAGMVLLVKASGAKVE